MLDQNRKDNAINIRISSRQKMAIKEIAEANGTTVSDMIILHLNLKKKWFDMILSGDKKEEYREIKPYWSRLFQNGKIKIKGRHYHPSDVVICFSNGYAKDRPQFHVQCKVLVVRTGYWYWGAKEGEQYYVLVLGDILF